MRTLAIPPTAPPGSATAGVIATLAVIVALYLGQDVFIPLALAILLSFALGPVYTRLMRWGVPRVLAVIIVITLLVGVVLGFAVLVATQLAGLAQELPRYEYNLRTKIRTVAEATRETGIIGRTADMLRDISEDLRRAVDQNAESPPQSAPGGTIGDEQATEKKPIPVEVHEPASPPLETIRTIAGPLLAPVATAGLVLVFIIFVLLQRSDLRDRLIRLFGANDVHRTTEAIDDAAERIGRYLLMQAVVNISYGVPVGIGLWLIGIPNALLWGVLATVLRFIPYAGPVLAALFPVALSFAIDTGWTAPLLTIALFLTLELFSNNVMEPWLYGSSTGLSPFALIVSAVFWTTLWGPIGLLLSTPLTVCLVVLGRHVPQLQFLEVMLGDEPVLDPDVRFYQRLLAGDPDEAELIVGDLAEEQPLAEVFSEVVMPALIYADQERHRGVLDRARAQDMAKWATEIVEGAADEAWPDAEGKDPRVLCVGLRNAFDQVGAVMLARLLRASGVAAGAAERQAALDPSLAGGHDVVVFCSLNFNAVRQARRAVLRLKHRRDIAAWVALWGLPGREAGAALTLTGADAVVGTPEEAVERLAAARVVPPPEAAPEPEPGPAREPAAGLPGSALASG